ncbi:tripartite tricarboxylate transporter substrate binding protein [Siccirubricoccus sp. G192]|uniref:tripartite tricarboxylate transporter substrate binding protein n=1 Tax=Siccirubricoccus sp. G192 TaxID=2849651 RepID=UPI001C2BB1DD|nr:tripartite tricarboxylate transporter substrate binding protein [Siccirubricoccus sp. G192]MBV1798883.1 tripartite tricarboxylate transporter substrate binding protein [Siccirubricoccus sp. G192]
MQRRFLVFGLAAGLPAVAAISPVTGRAQSASWPDRPLRIIVPFPPGGAIDAMTRLLAPRLSDALGQPAVVENRTGAGGTIGSAAAAQSTDGHTLLMVSIAHAVNPALYPRLPYDSIADFAAVAPVAIVPNLLAVPAARPWRSQADLVEAARKQPGELTYGSAGSGTSIHLAGALFCAMAGIEMIHVPYRGSGPAVADLVSGRLDAMFDSVTSASPHIASGRLRALAVTTGRRIAAFPELPTVAEAGVPGYAVDPWFVMLAPRSLPTAARERVGGIVGQALQDPPDPRTLRGDRCGADDGRRGFAGEPDCQRDREMGRPHPPARYSA